MKSIVFIFTFLFSITISAQDVRPIVLTYADSIAQLESIPVSRFIYPNKITFPLDSIATIEELLKLTNHKNPNVRSCALIFLLNREDNSAINFPTLFSEHLLDTSEVKFRVKEQYQTYDEKMTVSSLYAKFVGGYSGGVYRYSLPLKGHVPMKEGKYFMDSLIICQSHPLKTAKEHLVFQLPVYPSFYPHVKKQVIESSDVAALVYLAKFQKEEDIDLILEHLPTNKRERGSRVTKRLFSLQFFQHPRIFEFLKNSFEEHWKDSEYIRRVAEYQSPSSLDLLNKIYSQSKRDEKKHNITTRLRRAIYQNYEEIYADLFIQILEENAPFGYARIPDLLWEHRGEQLFQFYETWSASDNKWAKRDAAKMYPKAREYMEKNNPQKVAEVVLSQIKVGGNYSKFSRSFLYIHKSKDPVFVDPLFEILAKEPHAKQRFFITKILMDYNDSQIIQRLENFYKSHPDLIPDIKAAKEGGSLYKSFPYYAKQKYNY